MAVIDGMSINGNAYDLRDKVAVRFNEVQSLTDAQKAQARVNVSAASVADVNGKVAISQGIAQAGKALVVGEDGNVTLGEAGIPGSVATALLDLLQHVAYTDGSGQNYYNALTDALGGDYYNTWSWRISSGQLTVDNGGTTVESGTAYITDSDVQTPRRRALCAKRGLSPYYSYTSQEATALYPIPIPSTAGKCTITVTPAQQCYCGVYGYDGSVYAMASVTGWIDAAGRTFYFAPAENQFLVVALRVDASNTNYTSGTEPSEVDIEFGVDDYYNRYQWRKSGGELVVEQSGAAVDAAPTYDIGAGVARLIDMSSSKLIRRAVCAKEGLTQYINTTDKQNTGVYPIPVPAAATKMTISVTPSGQQYAPVLTRYANGLYTTVKTWPWIDSNPCTFDAGENQFLILALRVNSSNAQYTSSTEPTEVVITFEEA